MKLIVYGTLMTGESNHHILKNTDAMYMGDVIVPNAILDNLGGYPGLHFDHYSESGTKMVHAELWDVPEDMIGYLDAFEGVPHLYDRRTCKYYDVNDDHPSDGEALIYEYQGHMTHDIIESGNWKQR